MAKILWVRSSEGRKWAETAEREKRTGVTRQWTKQRAEARTPARSAVVANDRGMEGMPRLSRLLAAGG